MPDEPVVPAPAETVAGAATETKPPEKPVVIAKPAPTDELGDTFDAFFAGMQSASLKTLKTILAQFKTKADDVITKLDGDVGIDPPKKQD